MNQLYQRYAVALFSLASEKNQIEDYLKECEQLIEIFEKNEKLICFLKDYGITSLEKKEMLSKLFKNKIKTDIYYFMCVIIDNHRGKHIKDILKEFVLICLKRLNIKTGIVYSTVSLNDTQINQIEKKVSKLLNAKVRLTNKISPDLIGGLKIEVEDYLVDYSIQSKFTQLKNELNNMVGKEDSHEN